ncbi:MAG: AAA family ATPase [Clostridia bacterium]|nr:AAA family ATPase [Clostridia bacterium]
MIIKSINILGFGKLSDFSLDFSDSANVVYGGNEDGKTTIMAFIKMMFYGTTTKQSESYKNPRKRYKPLNTNAFGGNIVFFHNGINYRLEREFKGSNSTDKITLYNLDRLEPVALRGNDVGSEFFALSAEAFEKSVYIGGIGYEDLSGAGGEINSKLANITQTGDEDVSFDLIKKRLNGFKTIYTTPRKVGALDALKKQSVTLADELYYAKNDDAKRQELASELKDLEEQKKLQLQRSDELKKTLESLKASQKMAELKQKLDSQLKCNEYKQNIENLKAELTINGKMPQKADIDACVLTIAVLDNLKAKIDSLGSAAPDNNADINLEIEQKQAQLEQINHESENFKKQKPNGLIFSVILLLGVLGSLFGVFKSNLFIIPLAVFGIAYIIFMVALILKKSKFEAKTKELDSKKAEIITTIQDLRLKKLESDSGSASVLETLKKQEEEQFKKLISLISGFSEEKVASLQSAAEIVNKTAQKLNTLSELNVSLSAMSALISPDEFEAVKAEYENLKSLNLLPASDEDIAYANALCEKTADNISQLSSQIANYSGILSSSFAGKKTVAQIEAEIEKLEAQIKNFERLIAATDLSLVALEEAYTSLRGSFSGALNKKVSQILGGLTNGKYTSVGVSDSLCVNLDSSVFTDARHFSSGTLDQAYFALRLGVAELISDDVGGLPLLLDDAFLQYDDERMKNGFRFLADYKGQSIMFTCRKEFANFAGTLENTNIINL